uniref:hypothetical protein n=1 Tax=Candidatus Electronema sp. TaxID=2698783 RepID=UPI00405799AE
MGYFLWYSLKEINASFEKLNVRERVPMPDDPQRTADYETLLKYAQRGNDMYIPDGSDKEYSVKELLGLVQPKDKGELVRLGEKIGKQGGDEATWLEMMNDLFELKPSILGITFNLHGFFREILARQKQNRR